MALVELHTQWQLALEHWADLRYHDTLLGLAAKHQQLAWLAGKYRDAAWSNPNDTIAPVRLARVQRCATLITFAKVAPEEPKRRPLRGVATMLVGAMLATAMGLYIADYKLQQRTQVISRHP